MIVKSHQKWKISLLMYPTVNYGHLPRSHPKSHIKSYLDLDMIWIQSLQYLFDWIDDCFLFQTGVLLLYTFPALSQAYSDKVKPYSHPIVIPLTQVISLSWLKFDNWILSGLGCSHRKCLQCCHCGHGKILQYL